MKKLSILFALISTTLVCAQTIDKKASDTLKDHQVKTIQEVTIVGKKAVVENKVDKIVYNVANDITSQSGAAIDVLRKVPQVTVDADGNVELQGNPNVRFLINGKPSSIFGNSLADALASIPASQIKSIEAVTSPGARYDAQGTGGIINIVLNENKVKGINGLINASAGTRFETGSLNLNFRNNNFSLNTFFSGNAQLKSRTPFSQDRISHTATTQTRLLQDGYTDFQRHGYRTGLGFDWTINKTNTLTGYISYNDFANKSIGLINQQQYINDFSHSTEQSIIGYRTSDNRSSVNSIDGNLSYRKTFQKEGQELTADYVVSYGSPKSNYLQTQSLTGAVFPYDGFSGSNPGTDTSHNLSVDYVQPINDQITLEMGTKAIFQHITTNTDVNVLDVFSGQYEFDPFQSYHLKYDVGVYAAYISSSLKLFNNWLDVRAGARYEYTTVKIDYQNTNIPSYSLLVPSFILSHKFDSGETIKLAYTRRVERPEYAELNPFLNFSDPHNITTGNPALKPELGDNMELGYNKNFENGANLSFTLTERINSQDLKQITTFYPIYTVSGINYTNVSVTRRDNIGKEYNSGGILSGSVAFLNNKLNLRGNMMVFHRYIVSNYFGNVDMGMRYRLNLNLNYLFPKDFIVEAFGNYNSAAKNIQGKNPQSITYSIAARKQFWNKKASIGITTTNPFNKYIKQATTVETGDYSSSSIRYLPLRSFGISFSYKFGKDFKKEKDISDDYLNAASQGN
ncbi:MULTISPECIES: outer membrane beta-barrel family protein [Chryseobacterium]|uniref:outer membrane beta-barrel family protein n=1 Tax=Chryseobacterium TaxID=59732 RepID=UPI0004291A23|nr:MULTISPECIES: outer membrane beta-barrel family protein [Chryseobacterium]AZA53848.1 TonB-dependent receptor [Chryseobacterium sp. G0201]